jgi:CheY-like chemotaxis protein
MTATILLVEDEPLLREMTREDLEDLGYVAICAGDCEDAWPKLKAERTIELLITDIRMPGDCDGWELARRARALRPDLAVIYISGYSADQPQPVPGGIFVKKPYRLRDIEQALAQLGVG